MGEVGGISRPRYGSVAAAMPRSAEGRGSEPPSIICSTLSANTLREYEQANLDQDRRGEGSR